MEKPRRDAKGMQEFRWCKKWGYFIALAACAARASRLPYCRHCFGQYRQLSLPFGPEDDPT